MRTLRIATAIAAIALTLTGCVAREQASNEPSTGGFTTSPTETESESEPAPADSSTTEGDCGFKTDQSGKEPAVGLPPDDGSVTATSLTLTTSAGPIAIQLDAGRAPCTVQSMVFLAGKGFFDNTTCHRLTANEGLKVLQCGDPEGTGAGGPGYVVPDELPKDLPAGQSGTDGTQTVTYPRGIVAMANAGPGTTGSQFFLVYGDSTLPPNYTVWGTLDATGLTTLDQIAAGGITPGQNGAEDGAPATPVTIQSAKAA